MWLAEEWSGRESEFQRKKLKKKESEHLPPKSVLRAHTAVTAAGPDTGTFSGLSGDIVDPNTLTSIRVGKGLIWYMYTIPKVGIPIVYFTVRLKRHLTNATED